ncbi:TPA: hypothetical protein ACGWQF_004600, partial [Salmonella enterica]
SYSISRLTKASLVLFHLSEKSFSFSLSLIGLPDWAINIYSKSSLLTDENLSSGNNDAPVISSLIFLFRAIS